MTSEPSDLPVVDPDAILRQPFTTVRKGYDPLEVQKYLMALASELRAGRERERVLERQMGEATRRAAELEHLSPQRLTSMLGEETAKVIEAANGAADDIRTKAEENVARLLRDAQEQANRTRRQAEEVLRERTAEAEEASARIRRQADETLQQARIDADADAEQGRARGRELVAEAQRLREKVLRDLVRRRKTLAQQIEQLNAGRERLIEAYVVVRDALDATTGELDIVLPEAKARADLALQRAIDADTTPLDQDMAALEREMRGEGAPEVVRPTDDVSDEVSDSVSDQVAEVVEVVDAPDDDVELVEEVEAVDVDDYREPRAPDPVAGRRSSAVNVIVPSLATEEPEVEASDEVEVEIAEGAEPSAPEDPELASSSARVAHLFARIRLEAGAGETHGEAATRLIPTDAVPVEDDETVELAFAPRCGLVVRELERSLARHVKRELSDEQNEMLDALRREVPPVTTELLADPEGHVERYADAAAGTLSDAVLAGGELLAVDVRRSLDGSEVGELARALAAELAAELVAPLRERVESTVAAAGHDPGDDDRDLSEELRADYREWRTQRVDPLVTRAVVTALNRGVLASVEPGTLVCWLVTDEHSCTRCHEKASVGAVPAGESFAAVEAAPPIHDGCRCLLVSEPA